jgi:Tfp pilus assembly protein PilN
MIGYILAGTSAVISICMAIGLHKSSAIIYKLRLELKILNDVSNKRSEALDWFLRKCENQLAAKQAEIDKLKKSYSDLEKQCQAMREAQKEKSEEKI